MVRQLEGIISRGRTSAARDCDRLYDARRTARREPRPPGDRSLPSPALLRREFGFGAFDEAADQLAARRTTISAIGMIRPKVIRPMQMPMPKCNGSAMNNVSGRKSRGQMRTQNESSQ